MMLSSDYEVLRRRAEVLRRSGYIIEAGPRGWRVGFGDRTVGGEGELGMPKQHMPHHILREALGRNLREAVAAATADIARDRSATFEEVLAPLPAF